MSSTHIEIPKGWLRNAAGNLVHESEIRDQDKLRDRVVTDLVKEALALNESLKAMKVKALADIDDLISIAGEKYDMKIGGPKGNVSLFSFDGRYKIQRVFADRITYTEEMEVAKSKVFECINGWGQNAHEQAHKHLFTLATNAFRLNGNGEISISRVTEMMRADIDDPEWQKAMQAVKDSLIVCGSAVYIRVYERVGEESYRPISLDIARV